MACGHMRRPRVAQPPRHPLRYLKQTPLGGRTATLYPSSRSSPHAGSPRDRRIYLLSCIFNLLSSIFHLLSSTFYLLSSIFYLLSSIFHLLCSIFYLLSSIFYLLSSICYMRSHVVYLPSFTTFRTAFHPKMTPKDIEKPFQEPRGLQGIPRAISEPVSEAKVVSPGDQKGSWATSQGPRKPSSSLRKGLNFHFWRPTALAREIDAPR